MCNEILWIGYGCLLVVPLTPCLWIVQSLLWNRGSVFDRQKHRSYSSGNSSSTRTIGMQKLQPVSQKAISTVFWRKAFWKQRKTRSNQYWHLKINFLNYAFACPWLTLRRWRSRTCLTVSGWLDLVFHEDSVKEPHYCTWRGQTYSNNSEPYVHSKGHVLHCGVSASIWCTWQLHFRKKSGHVSHYWVSSS